MAAPHQETSVSPFARALVQVVTHQSRAWVPHLAATLAHAPAVTVADNASTDATAEAVGAALPQAGVLRLPVNLGFGAAHNLAAREGLARWPAIEFILLLNPDCEITEATLGALVSSLDERPSVGAVAPSLKFADGSDQTARREAFFRRGQPPTGEPPRPAEWLSGACLLVRRTAWEAVRGFDARYFLFYEDDDLCLRLQRAGWECWHEAGAQAIHARGTGSRPSLGALARKSFHLARSKRLAISTWVGAPAARWYRLRLLLGAAFAVPMYVLAIQPKRALKWAARGLSAFAAIDRPWRELPGGAQQPDASSSPSRRA